MINSCYSALIWMRSAVLDAGFHGVGYDKNHDEINNDDLRASDIFATSIFNEIIAAKNQVLPDTGNEATLTDQDNNLEAIRSYFFRFSKMLTAEEYNQFT